MNVKIFINDLVKVCLLMNQHYSYEVRVIASGSMYATLVDYSGFLIDRLNKHGIYAVKD